MRIRYDTIRMGMTVRAWMLDAISGAATLAAVFLLAGTNLPLLIFTAVCVIAAVALSWTPIGWAPLVPWAITVLTSEPHPARTALAILVTHLIVVVASLSAALPARTRITPRALWPTARRFLLLQVISQAVALAVAAVTGAVSIGIPGLAAVGAAAVVVLVVVVGRRMSRDS